MDDDSAECLFGVLSKKRAQPQYVPHPGLLGSFHFDAHQPILRFDDEIDFVTTCSTPIRDLRLRHECVPPREQITQHEVLEVRAGGRAFRAPMREMQRETRVIPVQLRRLDQPG